MGLFGKVFGKEDKKDSCCCDMEIVEVPEGEEAPAACECDSSGADAVVLTVLGPGCKRCHQLNDNAQAAAWFSRPETPLRGAWSTSPTR